MQEDRDYSVYPSNLDRWAAFNEFNEYLKRTGYKGIKKGTSPDFPCFKIEVNEKRRFYAKDYDEFLEQLKKYPYSMPLFVHSGWNRIKTKENYFSAMIAVRKPQLSVAVNSDDLTVLSAIHEKIQECFRASNPDQCQTERLSRYDLKKSVFLAHRFDEIGNSAAQVMWKFLSRLGFDVKEGSGYEARDIPSKVKEKIESQDIFVCLVTPGDSAWLISEGSTAKALGKYLVVVCQDGVDFKKGIIGEDYEHIPFPEKQVEKSFMEMLYALPLR